MGEAKWQDVKENSRGSLPCMTMLSRTEGNNFFGFSFVFLLYLSSWAHGQNINCIYCTRPYLWQNRDAKKIYAIIVPDRTGENGLQNAHIFFLDLCCFETCLLLLQIFSSYLRRVLVLKSKIFKIPFPACSSSWFLYMETSWIFESFKIFKIMWIIIKGL